MERKEEEVERWGAGAGAVVIAMKGHPGTGKSSIAKAIATSLHLPLLDKDDIRDATLSLSSSSSSSSSIPSSSLNDLSYEALWRVASTQLRLNLSLVIDSPLSRRAHLDRILQIVAGPHRVLIVECKPSDQAEWRRPLERRDAGSHKPATWDDLERLLEAYAGCTEYDVGDVAKLVVDTTAPGLELGGVVDQVLSSVTEFIHSRPPHPY